VQIDVPRDRRSEFEPQLIKRIQRASMASMKIISLYARGMTQREIQGISKRSWLWKSRPV